jgi:hypothetical protein
MADGTVEVNGKQRYVFKPEFMKEYNLGHHIGSECHHVLGDGREVRAVYFGVSNEGEHIFLNLTSDGKIEKYIGNKGRFNLECLLVFQSDGWDEPSVSLPDVYYAGLFPKGAEREYAVNTIKKIRAKKEIKLEERVLSTI